MSSKESYTHNSRNKKSMKYFIDELFTQYAKLLTVRVDLGYKTNSTLADESRLPDLLNTHSSPHAYLTKEQIEHNWNTLLNKLRWNNRSFLNELVGYAWKIEYGSDKGVHYHIMLFFNGNKVQSDYYYANEFCKLWSEITQDMGTKFNCSIEKAKRYGEKNCLGVTHRNQERQHLYHSAFYLTKTDHNEANARFYSGGRLFGKSVC